VKQQIPILLVVGLILFLVSLFLLSTTIGGVMVNLLTLSVLGHRQESDQPNLSQKDWSTISLASQSKHESGKFTTI
jgi:membrane-bound ClpP family serine protease